MSRCASCQGWIESGVYCDTCLSVTHCQAQIQSGYQAFLATLPAYEDKIGPLMARVARFDIPDEKLAGFQAICQHHFTIELRKDELHVTICQTCGTDIHPF